MQLYILYESASGYALFEKEEFDETGGQLKSIQKAIPSLERFTKMVKLAAFQPFTTAEEALENIKLISQNKVSETLKNFLNTIKFSQPSILAITKLANPIEIAYSG